MHAKPEPHHPPATLGDLMRLCAGELGRNVLQALAARRQLAVSEIAERIGWGRTHVSEHLAQLRSAGIVEMKPDKKWRIYRLAAGVTVIRTDRHLGIEIRSTDTSLLRFEQALRPGVARRLRAKGGAHEDK